MTAKKKVQNAMYNIILRGELRLQVRCDDFGKEGGHLSFLLITPRGQISLDPGQMRELYVAIPKIQEYTKSIRENFGWNEPFDFDDDGESDA